MDNTNIKPGFSDKINAPDFYKKNNQGFSKNQQIIFLAIDIITLLGIIYYGYRTDDLKGALLISAMFFAVSLIFFFGLKNRQQNEITYDGTIKYVEKQVEDYKKTKHYLRSLIIITSDDGKDFAYSGIISSLKNDYTTYYKEGDKVRHHNGFDLPEKYDKSNDEKVVCILCGQLADIENDNCTACGKILLK